MDKAPKTWMAINMNSGFREEVTDAKKTGLENDPFFKKRYRFEPLTAPAKAPEPKGAKKSKKEAEEKSAEE